MSITDELRDCIRTAIWQYENDVKTAYIPNDKLLAIADRIDERYHRDMATAQQVGINEGEDAAMRDGWVELPKGADGEYIHIGDRMENNERVARIVLTDDSWEPSVYLEKLPNVLHEYFCNEVSHHHAPTVEDVLREMLVQAVGYSDANTTVALNAVAEFAAKLRLAEEDE